MMLEQGHVKGFGFYSFGCEGSAARYAIGGLNINNQLTSWTNL